MAKKTTTTATVSSKPAVRAPAVKVPAGVTMGALSSGTRPDGFLVIPTEDHPNPCTFLGVLRAIGTKASKLADRKPHVWGVFEAVGDQGDSHLFDRETGETKSVENGDLVAISQKGALHGMRADKIGHLFALEFTGQKIKLGGGRNPMWEILAQVSAEPYEGSGVTE